MSTLARSLPIALALSMVAAVVHAQPARTWVSGVGNDLGQCSRTDPCRNLAAAIHKTAAGGEISILDPGGYGSVTITKSITISGDGTLGSILHTNTQGIIVNITSAADVAKRVVLRNLSFNGAGSGLNAIRFLAGNELLLENVSITGCTQKGIDVSLGDNARGTVYVQDAVIANCPTGIRATATSGFAEVILDHVRIEGATNGVELAANGRLIATESAFLGNGLTLGPGPPIQQNGVLLNASNAQASLDRCLIAFNSFVGVHAAFAGTIARISSSAFFNNSNGVAGVGTALSDGRNVFAGNGSDGNFNGGLLVK
jgi:hypothetical protein